MKSYKPVLTAGLLALATALPLQTASAAPLSDAQACSKAELDVAGGVLKGLIKGLKLVCKGKTPDQAADKNLKPINKAINKANAVHAQVDCNANQDPDSSETWPIEIITQPDLAAALVDMCDGV